MCRVSRRLSDAAELNRECRVARSERSKAAQRQQATARECEMRRRRNESELDGLKRVHAAHLYLREQREKWREARVTDKAARDAVEDMKNDLASDVAETLFLDTKQVMGPLTPHSPPTHPPLTPHSPPRL